MTSQRPVARLSAIALFALAPIVWAVATSSSQESEGGHWNTFQLVLSNLLAASLALTGAVLLIYSSRRHITGRHVAAAVLINFGLFAAWIVGGYTWCSSCGTP